MTVSTNIVHVKEGDKVEVTCHGSGKPKPTVDWNIRNITLERMLNVVKKQAGTTATLRIENVTVEDNTYVLCTARNIVGKQEATLRLNVSGTSRKK